MLLADTCLLSKPKAETTKVAPFFTEIVNVPSLPALTPLVVLFSSTLAPATGSFFSSITLPVIVTVCAKPTMMVIKKAQTLTMIFLVMLFCFVIKIFLKKEGCLKQIVISGKNHSFSRRI